MTQEEKKSSTSDANEHLENVLLIYEDKVIGNIPNIGHVIKQKDYPTKQLYFEDFLNHRFNPSSIELKYKDTKVKFSKLNLSFKYDKLVVHAREKIKGVYCQDHSLMNNVKALKELIPISINNHRIFGIRSNKDRVEYLCLKDTFNLRRDFTLNLFLEILCFWCLKSEEYAHEWLSEEKLYK